MHWSKRTTVGRKLEVILELVKETANPGGPDATTLTLRQQSPKWLTVPVELGRMTMGTW